MKNWLENLEFLEQEKTSVETQINYLGPIKAVLWDIYGTLMISASGDIDKARFSREVILESLEDCQVVIEDKNPAVLADELMKAFPVEINLAHQKEKKQGNLFPEVDIIEIWQKTLEPFIKEQRLRLPKYLDFRTLAFRFELGFNRIGPMIKLKSTVQTLASKVSQGIISNAQFYTPIIMNYLLENKLIDSATISYFEADLCFYSFQYRRAKPGEFLYQMAREALEKRGISAEQTLYIGNDMLNDIWPAQKQGFKTILFAGDKRSLRLREDREEIKNIQPHGIITQLDQVLEFIKD